MASVVGICNRALQKLGAKRITAINQDSVNARACNVAYEPVRDAELEDHDWNFAIVQASLAEDSDEPDWGRAHAYSLPSDFIRLSPDFAEDNLNSKDWQIQNGKIYTDDSSPLYIRYVKRVTDPNEMTSLFREAISAKMAMEMCEELSQSNAKKESLKADYDMVIRRAKKSNAFQNVSQTPPDDEWITARA